MAKHMAPTRRSLTSALARVLLLGLVCQGLLLFTISLTRAQAGTPQVGDSFEYRIAYGLRDGTGWYSDWWERTEATGRYEITDITNGNITTSANYTWKYEDSYGTHNTSNVERIVKFNATTRNYTQYQTDLDEYDTKDGRNLAEWFWVLPNLAKGASMKILEDTYTVTNDRATVWSGGLPVIAMELQASGTYDREYLGQIWNDATYTDKYFMDPNSGYVISERYEEKNEGYAEYSEWATWTWYIEFDITASSYPLTLDTPTLVLTIIGITAAIVLPALGIFALYHNRRWRPRTDSFRNLGQIKISLVKHLESFPQHLTNRATDQFAAFLVDFAGKTLLAGGRIAVAADMGKNELLGVAYYNKEEGVGSIYCKNTEVTDALRQYIKCKDFFSEIRHEIPADLLENMRKFDNPNIKPQAFNLFETYQVLKLAPIQHVDYDTNFISYMQEKDLSDVCKVAKEVYGRGGKRTFRALLESGDIGFVARVKGQIAGFAFASFVNQIGRNHTLSVLPKFRNQGIGRELARARLATLANLGAQEVITEIADWNLPSLQVSSSLGFKKVGVMFVETAQSIKTKKTIVRW